MLDGSGALMEQGTGQAAVRSAERAPFSAFEDGDDLSPNDAAPAPRNRLEEFAARAAEARRSSFMISAINAALHSLVMSVFAILIAASFGLVSFGEHPWSPETRHNVLSALAILLAAFLSVVWFVVVWSDGWFLYKPEQAKSGKKGATRDWFDAITSGLSEEPADVSSGLSRTLKLSLRTKVFAGVLFMWGASSFVLATLIVAANVVNLLADSRFAAHAVDQFSS